MKRATQRGLQTLAALLGAALLKLWAKTMRADEQGREHAEAAWRDGPAIVVFWHSRFLFLPFVYPTARRIGVLISPSADGNMIATIIERLGRQTIRGSSRRGGEAALAEMQARLQDGWDVGIAVDGPLGPAYDCKLGPVVLAQRLGLPILPLVYTSSRGRALATWDRFWLPAPFSKIRYCWGEPLRVAPGLDLETARQELNRRMRELVATAEAWAQRPVPWTS